MEMDGTILAGFRESTEKEKVAVRRRTREKEVDLLGGSDFAAAGG